MSRNLAIARPYAKAIFELATQENTLAAWSKMLDEVALIVADKQVQQLMKNPNFSSSQLAQLFIEVGQNFSATMHNFINVLGKFKRLAFLPEIKELFEKYHKEAERIVNIELISAFDITEKDSQRLKEALARRMNCNIALQCITDSTILGGAIVRAGDLVIDGSARGRLAKLSEAVGIS